MVRFSSIAFGVLGCALSGAQSPAAPTTASIDVDFSKPGAPINPRLYGVFLEEINHGIDGGLYGEMIQNRGFEDSKAPEGFTFRNGKWRNPGGYATIFDWDPDKSIPFWSLTTSGGQGTMTLDQTNPLDPATPRSCRLDVTSAGTVGIANEGFWGVGVKKGEKYSLSFWAHGGASQPLIATLTDSSGKPISDSIHVSSVSDKWKKFEGTLTAIESDPHAKLQISTDKVGSVWFDMVSLFPKKTFKNRPNGLRNDIASMIADLQPGFVRFPGGCVVESSTVATTYNWKDTIGPLEKRQEMWNVWDYRRTSGMGIYEYLQFIEDLGAQPMYVGFAGQTCIYRRPAVVPMADMEPVVNRFTDLLDYANGPTSSEWGKARAEAGHPKPFNLNLMELGNENVGDAYTQRYEMIYPKVKAKAPNLTTIANEPQKRSETDMVDDHFYSSPQWFMNNVHLYDRRDRQDPPVYIGELAVTTNDAGKDRGNLRAALAEGAFMTGIERNGDVVKMVSYAPLLANVDGRTALAGAPPPWHGMIYFDSSRTFGTASYYLWKMFANNHPTENLTTTVNLNAPPEPDITGNIGVGTWETSAEYKDVKVEKDGQTLYTSNFANNADGWKPESGEWSVQDGAYRQSQRAIGISYFGDESWSNYTVSLKARKISGPEGFLVAFGHKGRDRYWWNIGGWGDHEHAIESNQNPVGPHVPGTIETNRWYDVKIEVKGAHILCYLDGKLVHDQTVTTPERLFAVSGRDAASGDLIVKVINATDQPINATVNLKGAPALAKTATLTVLTGAPTDNNTLDTPEKITPETTKIPIDGPNFPHDYPAYSATIIRVKTR